MLIKAMRYGHDYTARIDFSSLARATETLHATNACNEPSSSETTPTAGCIALKAMPANDLGGIRTVHMAVWKRPVRARG